MRGVKSKPVSWALLTQASMAFALGLTGAFVGLLTGAVLAPAERTETTLW